MGFDCIPRTGPRSPARRSLLVLALLAAGCAGAKRDGTGVVPAPAPVVVRHVVEPGQTLWRIATVYGVPLEELGRANGIDNPALVEVGQVLLVPGATEPRIVPPYPAPLPGSSAPEVDSALQAGFAWPVETALVLSRYGARRGGQRHAGIDLSARHGEPVRAARDGRVVYSGSTLRDYGSTIILAHDGGLTSLYAHNSELLAQEGEWVTRGQTIARAGSSGNATTDHCHFEIRRNEVALDPLPYLRGSTESPP